MGDPAVDLAMHDQRVDRPADIVDRRIAGDFDDAGIGIDLDLADMTAIGETREIYCLVAFGRERPAQFVGQIVAPQSFGSDLEDAERPLGSLYPETAVGELQIGRGGFHHMTGDLQTLGDDVARSIEHHDAREAQRAAGVRTTANRHAVGVAGHQPNRVDRHTEPFADQLREAGFVTLSVGYGPDHDFHNAVRQYGDLGALARCPGRGVDVVAYADPAIFAARPRRRPPRRKPGPVPERDDPLHDPVVGTAVIDHAERIAVRHCRFRHQIAPPQL